MALEKDYKIDLTHQYFQGIQKVPEIPRQEVHALWKKAKKGDPDARQKLLESNLKLVIPIAKKYRRYATMEFLDLIEEGNLGLMHAITKFKPEKGFRFSTYASYWIEQSIRRAIEEQSKTIRIPPHAWEALRKWFKTWDNLHGKFGRDPTITEMSKKTGLTARQIKGIFNAAEAAKEMGSFESPVGDEENMVLEEIIKDSDEKTPDSLIGMLKQGDELKRALKELTFRERQVLSMRYGLKNKHAHTLEELGKVLKLSRERVRQIENRALQRLKYIAHRIGLIETPAVSHQARKTNSNTNVMRLSKGILWSHQQQAGKKGGK
ncbi:RNA polymerase sigma factor RpoD/SigA [Elusimicrobiota bacterium]